MALRMGVEPTHALREIVLQYFDMPDKEELPLFISSDCSVEELDCPPSAIRKIQDAGIEYVSQLLCIHPDEIAEQVPGIGRVYKERIYRALLGPNWKEWFNGRID